MDAWMPGPRLLTPGSSSSPSPALQHRLLLFFSPSRISRRLHPVASIPGPISGDRAWDKRRPRSCTGHTPLTSSLIVFVSLHPIHPAPTVRRIQHGTVFGPCATSVHDRALHVPVHPVQAPTHRPKIPMCPRSSPEWGMSFYWGVQRGDVGPAHRLSVLCFQLFRSES